MSTRISPFKLSVVVPVFNEEQVIEATNLEIHESLKKIFPNDIEILYVNDGSIDNTSLILNKIQQTYSNVKVLEFSRNFGHQAAVCAGLDHASGDCVAIIDADLQDPPSAIIEMISMWMEGVDVVYAIRKNRKENLFKKTSYSIFYRLYAKLSDISVNVDSGDFCLLDKKVVEVMKMLPEKNKFLRGLRAWSGFSQKGFKYNREARYAGESKYTFYKLLSLAADGIFNFSTKPLRIILLTGICFSLFSIISLLFLLMQKIIGFKIFSVSPQDVPGWTSIALFLLFTTGLQFLFIGVVGEYVGRIYAEVKGRPIYILK